MTTSSLELKFVLRYKWWNYCLQFKINELSGETKRFLLFKLAQLLKLELTLIERKLKWK